MSDLPTEAEVLAAVSFDEARTTDEIGALVCEPADRWRMRGTIRNRLLALEAQGLVICDEERPMRWLRPEVTP